jgi:hypothetical protein
MVAVDSNGEFRHVLCDTTGRLFANQMAWSDAEMDWVPSDGSGSTASAYQFNNFEDSGGYLYIGESIAGGAWKINRVTKATLASEWATGTSGYSTAWTNRASQSYGY